MVLRLAENLGKHKSDKESVRVSMTYATYELTGMMSSVVHRGQ